MIPYFEQPDLGPFKPFGILVAIGIIVGSWMTQRRARAAGQDVEDAKRAIAWAVIVGFIGAHLVAIVFYKPHRIVAEGPIVLVKIWDGISSFGGFFGAVLGLFIFFGKGSRPLGKQIAVCALPFIASTAVGLNEILGQVLFSASVLCLLVYYWKSDRPWMGYAESLCQGLVFGWIFGRLGCTVAFDHPGQLSDFVLAQEFGGVGGEVRHNLGFYEFAYTLLVLTPVSLILFKLRVRQGVTLGALAVAYAPVRFMLDTLRAQDIDAADTRLFGLTPGQYSAVLACCFGIFLIVLARRRAAANPNYPRVWLTAEELAVQSAEAKRAKPVEKKKTAGAKPAAAKTKSSSAKPKATPHGPRRKGKKGKKGRKR